MQAVVAAVLRVPGHSYTPSEITTCITAMWDTGLDYDNVELVLKQLKEEVWRVRYAVGIKVW